jgi:hypothetical protein
MENRLVIKKIDFISSFDVYKQDIKIKLYHNNISLTSEIFWDYPNNEIINWKFIFPYKKSKSIDFLILDDELFNEDNIIGQVTIEPNKLVIDSSLLTHFNKSLIHSDDSFEYFDFPEPITLEMNIIKELKIIGKIVIDQYIIPIQFASILKCGNGWDFPDLHPKLNNFPLKKNNEIYQHIKIIDDKFGIDEKSKFDLYSEAFSRIIDEPENKPPLCFGIIGPDNFGKSNFMHNLKNKIIAKEGHYKNNLNSQKIIINFNAWTFESDDTIWASILMNIHDALEEKIGKNMMKWIRVKNALFPDLRSLIFIILKILIPIILLILIIIFNSQINMISSIVISFITAFSFLFLVSDVFSFIKNIIFSIADDILKNMEKPDWSKKIGFMNEVKNEFFNFINPIIKDNNFRLILMIDDLDRCSVEKIYTVIKALSLLKNSDCPIYIFITYDSIKINDAIKTYYKTKYQINTHQSKILLEKLINIPFCLPCKNISENLSLINQYIDEEYFLNLPKDLIKKIPEEMKIYNNDILDIDKTIENYYIHKFPNGELSDKKRILEEIKLLDDINNNSTIELSNSVNVVINTKGEQISDKLEQIELSIKRSNLTINLLENYYQYIIKIEKDYSNQTRLNNIKNQIYVKFIHLKKDYTNNYYTSLDDNEIKTFQKIISDTKNSKTVLNNYQVKKIINIYSIARFLLPIFLQSKKQILFYLIVLTENWEDIIIELTKEINKIKMNLLSKECLEEKNLIDFFINNDFIQNKSDNFLKIDEFKNYLTKFDIKIIDFIELEPYIFNLDRCLIFGN